jgi:hypothetical protein
MANKRRNKKQPQPQKKAQEPEKVEVEEEEEVDYGASADALASDNSDDDNEEVGADSSDDHSVEEEQEGVGEGGSDAEKEIEDDEDESSSNDDDDDDDDSEDEDIAEGEDDETDKAPTTTFIPTPSASGEQCTFDLRNLLASNSHQINVSELYAEQSTVNENKITIPGTNLPFLANEAYILERATDGCAQLLGALWQLPMERTTAGILATLPKHDESRIPRALVSCILYTATILIICSYVTIIFLNIKLAPTPT